MDVDISGAKKLWLIVTDGGNGYQFDWADWAEPKLIRADGTTVNLTNLKWQSATAGWGQVNINRNCNGGPLKILKHEFSNGIGTHAPSIIEYELPENFARFQVKAGLDNGGTEQSGAAQVEFKVYTEQPPTDALNTDAIAERAIGFEAAKAGLQNFTVADGLQLSVFAAEPMLRNPTDIDVDERGRVWVCEGVNYRSTFQPWGVLDPKGDRIVILEDTNGDGIADKQTVFYQGPEINSALGICVLGNKAIVSCSPNVFVFTDTDGDGRADKKELLFTGIGGVDHDHGVHAMVFGPDGKLYFNFGNLGTTLKRPDGSPIVDVEGNPVTSAGKPYRNGMVFRCNPDGSEVEVLAYNFRNIYEVAVDSFGTLWQSDNDDDGNRSVRLNYVMEHGNFGYGDEMTGAAWPEKRTNMEDEIPRRHWHQNDPGVVPNLLITGAGAPTGITVYEANLFPEKYRNQLINCDAVPRVVRSYHLTPYGAGYKAESTELVSTIDSWFRPSDVCVGPDGSLYISDWNDGVVGCHNMVDRELAHMTGRIYRLAPTGNKPKLPKYDFTTTKGCIEALKAPNNSTRYLAWTKLHDLQRKAEKELAAVYHRSPIASDRARALQLLARISGREKKYLTDASKDKDTNIRIEALRIAREVHFDVISLVEKLVNDAAPQVRRECSIALRHNNSPKAAALWTRLALQYDGHDRWYLEALGIGADGQWNGFLDVWLKAVGRQWNTPPGRDIIWRSRGKQTAEYLAKIITDPKTSEAERPRYFRSMDFLRPEDRQQGLIELLSAVSR